MIIDGDCHLASRADDFALDAAGLIDLLDENGVTGALCWPLAADNRAIAADNAAIYAGWQQFPDRIVPFGGINPTLGLRAALEEVDRCNDYGFRGIKLNGARDQYFIDDPALSLPVIERMAAHGMILALHCGVNDFERTHPFRVAKIAAAFPQMPVIMVHMGGVGYPGMHTAAIEFAAQHANILLADSHAQPKAVLQAIQILGAHRVCYGSDAPFQLMHVILAMHHALLRDLDAADRALVMGGNLRRLLTL